MDSVLLIAAVVIALAGLDVTTWLHATAGGNGAHARKWQRRV